MLASHEVGSLSSTSGSDLLKHVGCQLVKLAHLNAGLQQPACSPKNRRPGAPQERQHVCWGRGGCKARHVCHLHCWRLAAEHQPVLQQGQPLTHEHPTDTAAVSTTSISPRLCPSVLLRIRFTECGRQPSPAICGSQSYHDSCLLPATHQILSDLSGMFAPLLHHPR